MERVWVIETCVNFKSYMNTILYQIKLHQANLNYLSLLQWLKNGSSREKGRKDKASKTAKKYLLQKISFLCHNAFLRNFAQFSIWIKNLNSYHVSCLPKVHKGLFFMLFFEKLWKQKLFYFYQFYHLSSFALWNKKQWKIYPLRS